MQTLKSPKNILIVNPAIKKNPTKMTKEEFFARVDRAKAKCDKGQYIEVAPGNNERFLNSL